MFVNGVGAVATGITTMVVLVAKFMAGAWVTALLVPFADRHHDGGEAALLAGEAGDEGHDSAEPGESGGADCGDSDGAVGPDHGEGDAVRAAAVEGDQGGACALG